MRSFILNDTITPRRIKELMRRIELCDSKTIDLYLQSDGGDSWMADIFIDFTHTSKKKINLIGVGRMSSACAHIFLESRGKKSIHYNTIVMVHFSTFSPDSRLLPDRKSHDSILVDALKKVNEERLQKYSRIFNFTVREKSLLRKGGDLIIDYQRLQKSLPTINKLNLWQSK